MAEQVKLGAAPSQDAARDAVHVAVAPAVANETLSPGQEVALVGGESELSCVGSKAGVGIVDPFLKKAVRKGERFWLCLRPGTVTSLRHQWDHPDFPPEGRVLPDKDSVAWVEEFAEEIGQSYDGLLAAASLWVSRGDYTYDNSEGYKDAPYHKWEAFWEHYQRITGVSAAGSRDVPFTCSC